jgi:hypothetical protein
MSYLYDSTTPLWEVEQRLVVKEEQMTRHDQELLDKQISRIESRPPEGVLMLAMATVFFTGMAVGGFLFAYTDQPPLRMAANDIVTAPGSQPAPSIAR